MAEEDKRRTEDADRHAESQAILARMRQESEPGARGPEAGDRIERIGTRIGRVVGALVTIAILAWIFSVVLAP